MVFSKDNLTVIKGSDIPKERLNDFYDLVFSRRPNLKNLWTWIYRVSFSNNSLPISIFKNEELVAHVSAIPFKFKFDKSEYKGSWLIDFIVHPKHRRNGLGAMLSDELENQNDVVFTCCNDKAIKLLRAKGWEQGWNSYLHFFLLDPLKHPRIASKVPVILYKPIRVLSRLIIGFMLRKSRKNENKLVVKKLTPTSLKIFSVEGFKSSTVLTTVRDMEYLTWRFLESPRVKDYRIVYIEGCNQYFIIKLVNPGNETVGHIEILMSSLPDDYSSYKELVAAVNAFAFENKYAYVLTYTNDSKLSSELKKEFKSIVRYQNYAYKSLDSTIMGQIKLKDHRWEFMDSDFERYDDYL